MDYIEDSATTTTMLKYSAEQLAAIIALPIIIILLCWTVVIFHKNRKKWGAYDIPIVAVLIVSILRNITILTYTLAIISNYNEFNTDYCSIVTWIFNSIHTFQASSLTSIAVIGLFSTKLHRKSQSLRNFLTSTHIIYHLFCLTTLCACVGVAAILAQKDGGMSNVFADSFEISPCAFLPFELDIKFNVFIIVLHVFLASISLICFLIICFNYYKIKKDGFDYIKKSNSDLSELSNNFHGINANVNENRGFYDTYTVSRKDNNNYCNNKDTWVNSQFSNSDVLSNNSTTVSSTNSRRPCIIKQQQDEEDEVEIKRTGLETMHPVLIVCYLFYHIPLIILCVYPKLIYPWPVTGIALWLGLVQDLLIPIGLGIVDSRFCGWVSNVYRCNAKHTNEKLPQVGLDGKFRPFGLSSQPQSLDINHHERSKTLQQVEHRFPITNGSLYTSIDGRLPVIHNYRRHKEFRTGTLKQQHELQSSNMALHSSHLNRRDLETSSDNFTNCTSCEADQCPSHSDLHHLSPQYVHRKLSFLEASQNNVFSLNREIKNDEHKNQRLVPNHKNCLFAGSRSFQNPQNLFQQTNVLVDTNRQKQLVNFNNRRLSQSQESINHLYFDGRINRGDNIAENLFHHRSDMNITRPTFNLDSQLNSQMIKNSKNMLRLNKMRLSRSEESLNGIQCETPIVITANPQKLLTAPQIHHTQAHNYHHNIYSSDDEEYCFTDSNDNNVGKDYDSLSSSNSITTEANCDFEFYQTNRSNNNTTNEIVEVSNDLYDNKVNIIGFKPIESRPVQINVNGNGKEKHKNVSNARITRSNSKKSLESFHAFIEETSNLNNLNVVKKEDNVTKIAILHRSNSYTTLENKKRGKRAKKIDRSNSKSSESISKFELDDNDYVMKNKKIKSVEYLPNSTDSAVYIDDLKNNNNGFKYITSSVPDFKKVFISEYI